MRNIWVQSRQDALPVSVQILCLVSPTGRIQDEQHCLTLRESHSAEATHNEFSVQGGPHP